MKTLFVSLSLAFALSLAGCGDNADALPPPCPDSTVFAPCLVGSDATPTGRATCWTGAPVETATPVVGCILHPDTSREECVAACEANEFRSWAP